VPLIALLIAVVTALGPSATTIGVAIGLVAWSSPSRIIRSQVLSVRETQFVEAAVVAGSRPARVLLRHIAPQIINLVIVLASAELGAFILAESAISYLGFGAPPTQPSWGAMMSGAARDYVLIHPWTALSAGLAITLTVLSINLVGDMLRDELDPRSR
jgi:peptide/nickel transport system permease protein